MAKKQKCDVYTTTALNSSSFGSFIFLASASAGPNYSRENSMIMLSPRCESGSEHSSESGSGGGGWRWWNNGGSKGNDDDEDQVFKLDNLGGLLQLHSFGVPPCYQNDYFFKTIVGSCNGLVCLYDQDANKFSLWNPATKKHRIIPCPREFGVNWPHKLISFGLDVETQDYKVVLFTGFKSQYYRSVSPTERFCRVQVYSLSTDSWRIVKGITRLPGDPFKYPDEVLYLNGHCYFMAHFFRTKEHELCIPENDRFIISFDLTKEIITTIQLPDHHEEETLYLNCLADKLALFTVNYQTRFLPNPPIEFVDDYSLWVVLLNEGGSSNIVTRDSWTKLHSFQIVVERLDERNIPRGISKDGNFALLEFKDSTGWGKRMKLYHLVSKEVKRNFLSCGSVGSKANAYTQTQQSIFGGNDAAY